MKTRRRICRPTSGQGEGRASAPDSAGFREWQRIRPEFDSPFWRMPEKRPPARMDEAARDGSVAPADEGRAAEDRLRGNGKGSRK